MPVENACLINSDFCVEYVRGEAKCLQFPSLGPKRKATFECSLCMYVCVSVCVCVRHINYSQVGHNSALPALAAFVVNAYYA